MRSAYPSPVRISSAPAAVSAGPRPLRRTIWTSASAGGLQRARHGHGAVRSASAEDKVDRTVELSRLVEEEVRAVLETLSPMNVGRLVRQDDDHGVTSILAEAHQHIEA